MLGHLPLRYRVAVWLAGLVSFAGVGGWLAHTTAIPLVWSSGAAVAVLLGALATACFLHLLTTDARPAPVASERSARTRRSLHRD